MSDSDTRGGMTFISAFPPPTRKLFGYSILSATFIMVIRRTHELYSIINYVIRKIPRLERVIWYYFGIDLN